MIKVLEFIEESEVKPVGGPRGYVYNLTKNYNSSKIEISYLPSSNSSKKHKKIRLPKLLKNPLKIIKDIYKIFKLENGQEVTVNIDNFDIIHFHSTQDLYSVRRKLKNYKGKTILTSHSPKPLFLEFIEDWYNNFERAVIGSYSKKKYEAMDEYAFNNADYILFPCEYAEEPYINNWSEYKEIKKKNKDKYIYIETGAICKNPSISSEEIWKELNIQNKFLISYVGRHLEVKGYDKLKEYGKILIEKYKDVCVVVCGKEEPIKGLDDSRWIELGWTTNADSYIAASDVFVLPNKETYFDLIMIEVLSLGKIIIASYTGGNKYFEKFKDSGIFLYKSDSEFFQILDRIHSMSVEERKYLGHLNYTIYEENFNEQIFGMKYENTIKQIYNNKKTFR